MLKFKLLVSLIERLAAVHKEIISILLVLAILGDKYFLLLQSYFGV